MGSYKPSDTMNLGIIPHDADDPEAPPDLQKNLGSVRAVKCQSISIQALVGSPHSEIAGNDDPFPPLPDR